MDRTFETTIDAEGHLDLPDDVRQRHGLSSGARVRIEERDHDLIVTKIDLDSHSTRSSEAKQALEQAAGLLGTTGKGLSDLMAQRKIDRDKEENGLRS